MARKAAAYLRMSKDDVGLGLGIERQRDSVRGLAKAKAWRIDPAWVIEENNVSASNGGPRPGFERLLVGMESGQVQAVLVYSWDRLSRRLTETARLIEIAEKYDIPIATVSGDIDLSTGQGRGHAGILGAVAAAEIHTMSQRHKDAKKQSRQAGSMRGGGRRPYGFTDNRSETIPQEAAVLREVTERILAGKSLTGIVRDLNQRRIPTSYGLAWTLPRLQGTLKRPSLCGRVTYKGALERDEHGNPIIGEWSPILTEEEFDQLQVAIAARRRSPSKWTAKRKHLLSGITRCGLCGTKMIAFQQSNRRWTYVCAAQKHLSRAKDHVERHVIESVKVRAAESTFDIEGWSDEDGQQVRRQIADLKDRKYQAASKFADGGMEVDSLQLVMRALDDKIARLEESQVEQAVAFEGIEAVQFDFDAMDAMSLEEQRAAIAIFVDKIVIQPTGRGRGFNPEHVEIVWRDLDRWHWRGVVEA
jgi:site-specific DNA recombinase